MNFTDGDFGAEPNQQYMMNTDEHTQEVEPTSRAKESATDRTFTSKLSAGLKNKKNAWRIILVIGLLVLLALVPKVILSRGHTSSAVKGASLTKDNKVTINKVFAFNGRTGQDKIIDKKPINLTFVSVSLNKSILIKGQPATARDGKTFLILDLDLDNPYQEAYYMPVYNLVRLQQNDKFFAPDVHNGLVLIDPISTKSTRIGFLVDDKTHNFSLKIGEVNGEKQTIDLKL